MSTNDGTIDLTETVDYMKSTFVTWAGNYLVTEMLASAALSWLGPLAPFVASFIGRITRWIAEKLSNTSVMYAFFLNTAIRKPAQAKDYVKTVAAKNNLSPEVSDEVYKQAELDECAAFDRFVSLNN